MKTIEEFFEKLWSKYSSENPVAFDVNNALRNEGEKVINDHIAFRTFNLEFCNIDKIAGFLIENGYEEKEEYFFKEKKLHAKHYESKLDKDLPLVFISELELEKFSPKFQKVVKDVYRSVDWEKVNYDDILFSGLLWDNPEYEKYLVLKNESQYAAWLYTNGFGANHFTVSINRLTKYNSTSKLVEFLKGKGFALNTVGGIVKGSPVKMLEQLSTMADSKKILFKEGEYIVPTCFYEFAYRYKDENNKEFRGFIANSADKIFESTDSEK
ncbi:MAG: DUF1338 domain-containing protein [Bacteroidota bacterium]